MASFRYRAVNESGTPVAGTVLADNAAHARAQLRNMNLFPEEVKPAGPPAAGVLQWLPGARARAQSHVVVFTRQCGVLLGAGVPIMQALEVLARQAEYRPLSLALAEIREAVNSGRSFADALADYPRFFDRSYVGMVASGERSGTMDVVFRRLADFLERRRLMQSNLSTALIYPALLAVVAIALVAFLSGVVVPMIKPLLEQQGRPLPLSTWLLFRTGDLVRGYGWALLLAAGAAGAGLAMAWRTPRGRATLDSLLLRVPLAGRILQKSLVSRFTMSFATLLHTGVPAAEALEVLAALFPNAAFSGEIEQVRRDVTQGKDMSERMRKSRVFPPMVGHMVEVGEKSGSLAEVLEHVANAYDLEVQIASRRLLAVLEPALVLVMAAVVGFIAMALMVTILQLSHI